MSRQGQGANGAELQELVVHEAQLQLRLSDIQVQLDQLREQKELAGPGERLRFNRPIAELTHQHTIAALDFDATHAKIAALKAPQTPMAITVQPPIQPPVQPPIDRQLLERTGLGAFILMLPIVFALTRRIWLRGGVSGQPIVDIESSPRLQRLEEAIEAISIEVERIGEGQRFATRLLSERQAEPVIKRVTPPESPGARHGPGVITPH